MMEGDGMKELRIERLKGAIAEAERFLEKAEAAIEDIEKRFEPRNEIIGFRSAECAAVKRAAIDLKGALTKINRPIKGDNKCSN